MIQFIIIKGTVGYDVSECFETITWGGRKGAAPRNVKITLLDDDGDSHKRVSVDCEDGDQCVMYENGDERFRGIIVSHTQSNKKKLVITAYDNMYYLANNKDSFCYTNKTATEIFNDCMARIGMTGGSAVDTGYVIPELPKAKTTYYDVLLDALSITYKATGIRYYISSEKGNIHLKRIQKGEVIVLVGSSGCGKSTMLRCINALEPIQGGIIRLGEEQIDPKSRELTSIRQKIGMVFQSYELFPHMTVLDNILLAPMKVQKRKKADITEEAVILLERVGLKEKAGCFPRWVFPNHLLTN